jgi:hypothetical protein
MGSPHTLAHPNDPHDPDPTQPATVRAAEPPYAGFRYGTPTPTSPTGPLTPRELHRDLEDLDTRGARVIDHERRENHPTAADLRQQTLRQRATTAQLSTDQTERAFDRLNPTFGVPADTHDPLGRQAVRDREAALALGPRVAVATARENDRTPVIWLGGQDYRAADAIHHARTHPTHLRRPAERVGAER